jgi:hypothetical protein
MEFEEMQKIWDAQNNQPLYAINEEALHRRILAKKNQARRITNVSELLSIFVNLGGGAIILEKTLTNRSPAVSMYAMSAWMFVVGLYWLVNRIRRMKERKRFDRSMKGELAHALADAAYQVRLSRLMRLNIFPIGILLLIGIWEGGKAVWIGGLILAGAVLLYHLSGFEHNFYKKRKQELEMLHGKLDSNAPDSEHA